MINRRTYLFQNTYTNAEKLLAAAAELAQTGECNAEDIYAVAHELESHISGFAQRVEQRRRLLELSVLFYAHTEEVRHPYESYSSLKPSQPLNTSPHLPTSMLLSKN